jgi:hypothetical protein
MKQFFSVLFVLAFFYFIGVATSRDDDPMSFCGYQVDRSLYEDKAVPAFFSGFQNDTVLVRALKDSLWDIKTEAICKLLNDTCRTPGYKILVLDTTQNRADWNTPYGKRIYFRQCP